MAFRPLTRLRFLEASGRLHLNNGTCTPNLFADCGEPDLTEGMLFPEERKPPVWRSLVLAVQANTTSIDQEAEVLAEPEALARHRLRPTDFETGVDEGGLFRRSHAVAGRDRLPELWRNDLRPRRGLHSVLGARRTCDEVTGG